MPRSQPAQQESAGELEHHPGLGEAATSCLSPRAGRDHPEWLSAPMPLSEGPEPRTPLTGPHCSLVPTTRRKRGNYRWPLQGAERKLESTCLSSLHRHRSNYSQHAIVTKASAQVLWPLPSLSQAVLCPMA